MIRSLDSTYANILSKSAEVFALKGYEKASMREIARASGVSLAAPYYHFKNKETILKKTKDIKQQIDQLKTSNQIAPEFIEFYQQILLIQHKYKNLIDKSKLSVLASTVDIEQRLSEGRPLIDATNFYIDKHGTFNICTYIYSNCHFCSKLII